MTRNPLAPVTFLTRNMTKIVPMIGVIVLATMLVAGIVAIMDSIPLSIRTTYGYSKAYLGVSPRGDNELTPKLRSILEKESPVPIGDLMKCRASNFEVRSIVGPWQFVIIGLQESDIPVYIERMGGGKLEGRLPNPGMPEAVVSAPLARNLGIGLGGVLLSPETQDSYSPMPVKVVGIVDSQLWLALTSFDYLALYHMPPIDLLLAMSADPAKQADLDSWTVERFSSERARVFTFAELEKQTDGMFEILYMILNVVIGLLVVVITVMMSLLMGIYVDQRMNEFGLLQALGFTRDRLVRRSLVEAVLVVGLGWVLGVLVSFGFLSIVKSALFDPNAFMIDPWSSRAYAYTLPIPVAIATAVSLIVVSRFRRFDPIVVIERRSA